jgi:hypothetical protein
MLTSREKEHSSYDGWVELGDRFVKLICIVDLKMLVNHSNLLSD